LKRTNKLLYVEAYKIMAAITEVIRSQNLEYSPTAYFAMLQDMITSQTNSGFSGGNIEVLCYCYSAIISQLDFGVIANQETRILNSCE
jgi:hypothetical protein